MGADELRLQTALLRFPYRGVEPMSTPWPVHRSGHGYVWSRPPRQRIPPMPPCKPPKEDEATIRQAFPMPGDKP